jgi:uncharacterized membrane protein YdjX (TVP38/TMEM64 family)
MGRFRERVRAVRARIRAIRFVLLRLAALAVTLFIIWLGLRVAGVDLSVDAIEDFGDDLGLAGWFAFVPAGIVLNCLFLFFIPAGAAAAGLLFGTVPGALLAIVVAAGSAGIQNVIGRRWVGERAEHLLGRRGKQLDDLLDRRGFEAIFYARLTPFTPFTALNYASGVTRLGAWPMAIASGLAMGPRIYAYAALGDNLDDLWSEESIVPSAVIAVSAVIGIVLAARAVVRSRRA